jgi:hypothetical protein
MKNSISLLIRLTRQVLPVIALLISLNSTCQSSLEFDGINDMVKIEHGGAFNFGSGQFTIEFYLEAFSSKNNILLITNNISSNLLEIKGIYIGLENGKLYCTIAKNWYTSKKIKDNDGIDLRNDGKVHHIAISRSPDNFVNLYIDGIEVNSQYFSTTYTINNGNNLYIGNTNLEGTSLDFEGKFDNFRLWNYERSEQEIENNKRIDLQGNEAGLVGFWKFNENIGQISDDETSGNHNAILGNSINVDSDMDPIWTNDDLELPLISNLEIENLTSSNIPLYDFIEVGVDFDEFYDNAYNPDEVSVEATFTSPSGKTYTRFGFFYKDYLICSSCFGCNGQQGFDDYWEEQETNYSWRVRFTPDEIGSWTYTIKVVPNTNENESEISEIETFSCINSDDKGYLRVSNNDKYLAFENGSWFFGIGENIGWYDGIGEIDAIGTPGPCDNYAERADYSTVTLDVMKRFIDELSDNGGNFMRTMLMPWTFDPEWEYLNNYDNRQNRMFDFDKLVEHTRDKGIYFQLSLAHSGNLDWDAGNPNANPPIAPSSIAYTINNNPYFNELSSVNNLLDFYTSPEARKAFKNKLRYIVARWGYSPYLMSYELMNEVDHTNGGHDLISGVQYYFGNQLYSDAIVSWHNEMGSYLKSIDPRHMVTASFATLRSGDNGINELECIDYTRSHQYSTDINKEYQMNYNTQRNLNRFNKPFHVGEYGDLGNGCWVSENGYSTLHNSTWASAFSGSFSTALSWWWDSEHHHPVWGGGFQHFEPLSIFMQDIEFDYYQPIGNALNAYLSYNNILYGPNPTPDAPYFDLNGFTRCDWSAQELGKPFPDNDLFVQGIETSDDQNIQVFALYKENVIIGWVHNKHNYWYNLPHNPGGNGLNVQDCEGINSVLGQCSDLFNSNPNIPTLQNESMIINNLRCEGRYRIEWWSTQYDYDINSNSILDDGGQIVSLTQYANASNGYLTISIPTLKALGDPPYAPDYAFKIFFEEHSTEQGGWFHDQTGGFGLETYKKVASTGKITPSEDVIFYKGNNGRMQHFWWDGFKFQHENTGLYPDDPNHYIDGEISTSNDGKVFYRGTNGYMQHFYYNGTGWIHEQTGGNGLPIYKKVAADSKILISGNTIFYKGDNGRMQHFWWDGSSFQHENTGLYPDDPNHHVAGDMALDILGKPYYRGANGYMQHFYNNGSGWVHDQTGGYGLPSYQKVATDSKILVSENAIFYKGENGRMQHFWWDGSNFQHENTGLYPDDPNHHVAGDMTLDISGKPYYRGANGYMQHFYKNGSGWIHDQTGGYGLPSYQKVATDSKILVSENAIFYKGDNGRMQHFWWDGSNFQHENTGLYPDEAHPKK